MKDCLDYSLRPHNTFGIEARCHRFLQFETVEEAQQVAAIIGESHEPLLVLGRGSNLLLTGDFPGIVVRSAIEGIDSMIGSDHVLLRVGSGMEWDALVEYCVCQGWHGAENLSLIPGDVGASAVQNIGAYGAEVAQLIEQVEAVRISDGALVNFSRSACQYGYRQSRFKQDWHNRYLITHVTYRLSTMFRPQIDYGNIRSELERQGIGLEPTADQLRQVIISIRRQKLPDTAIEGNAGSFFVNPVVERSKYEELLGRYPQMPHYTIDATHEKIPAGWLIEQCGWKGRSLGRAGVHGQQALVLVNRGGATGADVVRLCEAIRADVSQQFGIEIHPEVNIV